MVVVVVQVMLFFDLLLVLAADCQEIKERGLSRGDGLYWLDPDGGSHLNAFQAYCDMTSYHGGWTMCYTTDDKVKPRTEFTYSAQLTYGSDGYRTNCNNIPVSWLRFTLSWFIHRSKSYVIYVLSNAVKLPILSHITEAILFCLIV